MWYWSWPYLNSIPAADVFDGYLDDDAIIALLGLAITLGVPADPFGHPVGFGGDDPR